MRKRFAEIPIWLWAAAIAPRAILFGLAASDPSRCLRADSAGYLAEAANLVAYRAFSSNPTHFFLPETFRTPGYALFLAPFAALFRDPVLPAAFVQCVLGVLTAALMWEWCRSIGGRRGAAVGALVMALDPVLLFHTPLVMTEIVYETLLVAALAQLWAARDAEDPAFAACCGILWSWAAFVRPISLYLPPFLAWWWRRGKATAIVFLAAAYCLPAVWIARNYNRTGIAVFSSIGGHDLLRYPAAGVESLRTGRPWVELDKELRGEVDAENPSGFSNDALMAKAYGRKAFAILKAHPFLLARYCAWGTVKILSGAGLEMIGEWAAGSRTDEKDQAFRPQATGEGTLSLLRRHPVLIPFQLAYMAALAALYLFFAFGVVRLFQSGEHGQAALLIVCFLYFLGLSSSQGYYRYRIPLLPILGAGAAATFREKKS